MRSSFFIVIIADESVLSTGRWDRDSPAVVNAGQSSTGCLGGANLVVASSSFKTRCSTVEKHENMGEAGESRCKGGISSEGISLGFMWWSIAVL